MRSSVGSVNLSHFVPRTFPSVDAAIENLGVHVSHFNVPGCLTDSGSVIGSSAVKDNFLVLGQGR